MNQDQHIKTNENLILPEGKPPTSYFSKPPLSTKQNSPVSLKNMLDLADSSLKEKNINHFSFSSQNNNMSKFSTNINSNDDNFSLQASKENRNILNEITNSPPSNRNADNNSGILLPNPLPKKKKALKNFEISTTTETTVENQTFSTTECHKDDQADEREEFRNYNRKLQGKTLQDRVELLGYELEVNIKQEVKGQLKEIREGILQARQKPHAKLYEIPINKEHDFKHRDSCDRLDSQRSVTRNIQSYRESDRRNSEFPSGIAVCGLSKQNENKQREIKSSIKRKNRTDRNDQENSSQREARHNTTRNVRFDELSQITRNLSKSRFTTEQSGCSHREHDIKDSNKNDSLLENIHQRSTERGSLSHREYRASIDTYEGRSSYKNQENSRDFDNYGIKNFDNISALSKEAILISSKLNSNVQQLRDKSHDSLTNRPQSQRNSYMNIQDKHTLRTQEDTGPRKKRRQASLVSFPSMQSDYNMSKQSTSREKPVQDAAQKSRQSVRNKSSSRTRTPSISSKIVPRSSTQHTGENESGGLYDITIRPEEMKGSVDTVRPFQIEGEEDKGGIMGKISHMKKLNLQDPRVRNKTLLSERDQEQIFTEREREIHFFEDKDNYKRMEAVKENQTHLIDKEFECVKLMKRGDYTGALEKLLKINKECGLDNTNLHSIYINYLIAECYCKTEHKALSETYAKRTLWVIESINKIGDKYLFLYYYGTVTLLAGLQVSNKHYEKAYELYEKARMLLETPQPQNSQLETQRRQLFEDLGTIKENIANVLLHLKDYEKAIKSYKEILAFIEGTNPPDQKKRIISCLKKLAQAYSKINSQEDTIACYHSILNLASSNPNKKESYKPSMYCYDQLGDLYFKQGMHLEALRFYRLSLKTKSEYYGVNSKYTGHTFIAIGKVYLAMKEYDKALSKLETGNEILEATMGKYTIDSANCYINMAQIKFKEHRYSESAEFYETVLDIYNRLLGENHIYTYRLYLNLIFLSFLMDDLVKVSHYEQKLESLLKGRVDQDTFIIYNEMGNMFRKNNDYNKAILYYTMSVEVFEALADKTRNYERISNVYCNIASSNLLQKNYKESIKFYKLALKILYRMGEKHLERQIQINMTLGKIYKGLKQSEEAFKYLERAMKLCLGQKKSSTQSRLPEIQKLLQEINS